jgi:hypothetical protein
LGSSSVRGWLRWLATLGCQCTKLGEGSSGSQASSSEEEEVGSKDDVSVGERMSSWGLQDFVEVDLLPRVNRFELGNKDRRAALDYYSV